MYDFIELFVYYLFQALIIAIVARALLSWFVQPGNRLMIILNEITDPIIAPVRRVMPRIGMIDLSPMVAIFLLMFLQGLLLQLLQSGPRF